MAARYWIGAGGNTTLTANWSDTSGGAGGFSVPTSSDDVYFDANSGDATVNFLLSCLALDFTGYANTLTMTASIQVFGSALTLSNAMTILGTADLGAFASMTLTSNGKMWPTRINFSFGTATFTFADSWTIGHFRTAGSSNVFNGADVNVLGNFQIDNVVVAGTANFYLVGTGTWSGNSVFRNNLTINTAGTLTVSGSVSYSTGTLTYTAGTVITTGSTLTITNSTTLNLDGIRLESLLFTIPVGTQTLLSDIHTNTIVSTGGSGTILNGFTIYCYNFTNAAASGTWTTDVVMDGTGTLSLAAGIVANLEINTSGTVTFAAVQSVGGIKRLKWTAGQVITGGSTLTIAPNATFTIDWPRSNVSLYDFVINSGSLIFFPQDTECLGFFNSTSSGGGNILSGGTLYVGGSLTSRISITSGSAIVMNGSGTLSCQIGGSWKNNLTIDSVGVVTMSGTINYNTGTLTYLRGKINVDRDCVLQVAGSTGFVGMNKIPWRAVNLTTGTMTMDKFFCGEKIDSLCNVTGSTITTILTTKPSYSHYATVQNVSVGTTSPFRPILTYFQTNKGGNSGLIFNNQLANGAPH